MREAGVIRALHFDRIVHWRGGIRTKLHHLNAHALVRRAVPIVLLVVETHSAGERAAAIGIVSNVPTPPTNQIRTFAWAAVKTAQNPNATDQ
jgi:hypothetical protein